MRVAVLIPGAQKGLQPVKFAAFLAALRAEVEDVRVWDVQLSRLDQLVLALGNFTTDRARLRARVNASPEAFRARSRAVARLATGPVAASVDAVLQVGVTFDAASVSRRWPLVIYTDYSVVLTRRFGREWRLALADDHIATRVAQEQQALSRADHVCTRSELVAAAIRHEQAIPAERVSAVGAGPNILARGLRADPPRLLFFGSEFRRKGGDLVLAAFALLRAEFDWIELDIVGAAAEGREGPGLHWHPGQSPDRVARLLGGASILLAPSRFETWGDVLVEAMAAGVVPVISDLPPMTEIVTHQVDGLVVPPEDAAALARAVRTLILDPERRACFAIAATQRVERDLNQAEVARKIATALRVAVAARQAGPARP